VFFHFLVLYFDIMLPLLACLLGLCVTRPTFFCDDKNICVQIVCTDNVCREIPYGDVGATECDPVSIYFHQKSGNLNVRCDPTTKKTAVLPDKDRLIGFLGPERLVFANPSLPELATIHATFDEYMKFVDLDQECDDYPWIINVGSVSVLPQLVNQEYL
jgi:hypothetical protein